MRTLLFPLLCLCVLPAQAQRVLRVNTAAAEGGDGTSWNTAFRSLQDALAASTDGDTLWIARGHYRPDDGAGVTKGDRDARFLMKPGLQILGGFRGDETRARDRDAALYETVVTGDLLGNDTDSDSLYAGHPARQNNARILVLVPENVRGVRLSGLTLRDASGESALWSQGGFALDHAKVVRNAGSSSITILSDADHRITDSVIEHNTGHSGGGLFASSYVTGLRVHLENVSLSNNAALRGGAVFLASERIDLSVSGCTFHANRSGDSGGAIWSGKTPGGARLTMANTIFSANETSGLGGAILAVNLSMRLSNVVFLRNRATSEYDYGHGGALYVFEEDGYRGDTTRITNSTFYGNTARRSGASILFDRSTRVLVHNSLFAGGSVTHSNPHDPQFEGTTELAAFKPDFYALNERTAFSHTLAEGGFPYFAADLGGNLDAAAGLCNPTGPDGLPGTPDDDLRPCPGSPAIDAGDATLLLADSFDLDGDGDTDEPLPVDFAGRERVFSAGGTPHVDLGAFEADASLVVATGREQPAGEALSVRVYPNPARGIARVEVYAATERGSVALFDVLGRAVLRLSERAPMQQAYALDTSGLPSGVYFVRAESAGRRAVAVLTVLR